MSSFCKGSTLHCDLYESIIFSDIALIILFCLGMILTIFGAIMMYRSTRKLRFEIYVILSGITESLCLLISVFYYTEILLQAVCFLQMLVVILITKRFLAVYRKLMRKIHIVSKM